jgi:glycosyltransferase involved in cell wall biosynthesis
VGRIEEHKNVPFLVRSYALLKKTGYKGRLVIAGTGSGLAAVREEIKRLRLQDSAALLGFVSEEEKISLLAQSEVLALPSRREGFPRVIAEAIASGLPVVTADYAENGAQFVVKEYGSGVVSESDEESFARSILKVLDNWVHYSLCAIRRREELDWSQITRLVIGLAEGNS